MKIRRLVQAASIAGVVIFMMAASASASVIYNTDALTTEFGIGGLSLSSSAGAAATLEFVPQGNSTTGVPSNINFGNFTLACPTCTTQAVGGGAIFSAFTFNLTITDVTDGATGTFVGTSTGGAVYQNLSGLTINWAPLSLGPGALNATSGNFGETIFSTTVFTGIVAPNSGEEPGSTTVQGFVSSSAIPEPMTFVLIGTGLLGLAILGRRRAQE